MSLSLNLAMRANREIKPECLKKNDHVVDCFFWLKWLGIEFPSSRFVKTILDIILVILIIMGIVLDKLSRFFAFGQWSFPFKYLLELPFSGKQLFLLTILWKCLVCTPFQYYPHWSLFMTLSVTSLSVSSSLESLFTTLSVTFLSLLSFYLCWSCCLLKS